MDNIIKNNYIAYFFHYSLIIVGMLVIYCFGKSLIGSGLIFYFIATPVAIVAYILCGFKLLKQNSRYSVMSTVSVFVSLIIITCIFACIFDIKMLFVYISSNIYFAGPINMMTGSDSVILLLISSTFPSLLMYLGIILKSKYEKKRNTKKKQILHFKI